LTHVNVADPHAVWLCRLLDAGNETEASLKALREAGKETDERLNALILLFERSLGGDKFK
jgi:hypothetical protein